MTLTTNVSYSGNATVIFEDRTVTVVDGAINDVLAAYGTGVYRFPPITSRCVLTDTQFTVVTFSAYSPTACSRVSASNILVNPSFEQVTSASSVDGAYLSIPTDAASTYLADSRFACL